MSCIGPEEEGLLLKLRLTHVVGEGASSSWQHAGSGHGAPGKLTLLSLLLVHGNPGLAGMRDKQELWV